MNQLVTEGGAIVTSGECSEMEIADAQATGRFSVREDGIGFVRRYAEWLAIQSDRQRSNKAMSDEINVLRKMLADTCAKSSTWREQCEAAETNLRNLIHYAKGNPGHVPVSGYAVVVRDAILEMRADISDASDQIGRAEMAEKAMYARVAELENRYRALIPGDVIQEWDEIFVYGDWMLADVKHYGILITQATGGVIRRRIGKDAPPKSQRIADALADGKPEGQEENA
jgi:hypothetical protein